MPVLEVEDLSTRSRSLSADEVLAAATRAGVDLTDPDTLTAFVTNYSRSRSNSTSPRSPQHAESDAPTCTPQIGAAGEQEVMPATDTSELDAVFENEKVACAGEAEEAAMAGGAALLPGETQAQIAQPVEPPPFPLLPGDERRCSLDQTKVDSHQAKAKAAQAVAEKEAVEVEAKLLTLVEEKASQVTEHKANQLLEQLSPKSTSSKKGVVDTNSAAAAPESTCVSVQRRSAALILHTLLKQRAERSLHTLSRHLWSWSRQAMMAQLLKARAGAVELPAADKTDLPVVGCQWSMSPI